MRVAPWSEDGLSAQAGGTQLAGACSGRTPLRVEGGGGYEGVVFPESEELDSDESDADHEKGNPEENIEDLDTPI